MGCCSGSSNRDVEGESRNPALQKCHYHEHTTWPDVTMIIGLEGHGRLVNPPPVAHGTGGLRPGSSVVRESLPS